MGYELNNGRVGQPGKIGGHCRRQFPNKFNGIFERLTAFWEISLDYDSLSFLSTLIFLTIAINVQMGTNIITKNL